MEEKTRLAVGIDLGTNKLRAVTATLDHKGQVRVMGYAEQNAEGMRRGKIKDLLAPAKVIDVALKQNEEMSGIPVEAASVSINSPETLSIKVEGMVQVGANGREVSEEDIARLEQVAMAARVPRNAEVLALAPYEYILDGQSGISDPLGMQGARLEIRANVIAALKPDCDNIAKVCENAAVHLNALEPAAVAAARAVLSERQKENGVAVVNLGGSTTSLAVYDEGELQYAATIPMGSNDITRDLAIILMTVPEVAEEIKTRYASAKMEESGSEISVKQGRKELKFSREDTSEVVAARLEDIFDKVRKHLKASGYDRNLPEGIVLVGGGAKLKDIDEFAREQLQLAVRIGRAQGFDAPSDDLFGPEYATAVGLMLGEVEAGKSGAENRKMKTQKANKKSSGFLKRFLAFFR